MDSLAKVVDAVAIGRHTLRVALTAIWIGIGLSVGLMVVAMTGVIPAVVGALVQELVDLATILYALRALSGPPSDLRPSPEGCSCTDPGTASPAHRSRVRGPAPAEYRDSLRPRTQTGGMTVDDPQVWTLIGVFAAVMLGGMTLMTSQLSRVIRAEVDRIDGTLSARIDRIDGTLSARIDGLDARLGRIETRSTISTGSSRTSRRGSGARSDRPAASDRHVADEVDLDAHAVEHRGLRDQRLVRGLGVGA